MAEQSRAQRLRAELDDGGTQDPIGELMAVWAALNDALWLGALRAVLAPTPPATQARPLRAPALGADDAARDVAA